MADLTKPRTLKRTIPPDLQRKVEDIHTKVPKTTGPSGDLDEEKKRWLIIGICLQSIISPMLRKYVDSIVRNLYKLLVSSHSINTQVYPRFLEKYPSTNTHSLSYDSINTNRNVPKINIRKTWKNNYQKYDYKVTSHVDLSKLFLKHSMAQYSAIDESCDLSALLSMVVNISSFPKAVQANAEKIRADIRNPWAHCDFREWTATKYTDSFYLLGQLVKDLRLSNNEENSILGELNTWATNGHNFLSGTTLGLEIVEEISQHTHVLSEYVQTLCSETDSQFIRVQTELKDLENCLQKKISNLERETKENKGILDILKEEIEDHIPKHIRAQHRQEISEWEQDQTTFVETRATSHILGCLPLNNCFVVTGSSGCGKSANIHHTALHLRDSFGYEIIPVSIGPTDILNYYNENKNQAFVVDDICGKETINEQLLNLWIHYSEKVEKKFKIAERDVANKNDDTDSKLSSPKLLISCRLHIYKDSQFQLLTSLTGQECNLLSAELCLLQEEKIFIAQNYIPDDIINNAIEVMEDVDFFPLLCKLSNNKSSDEVIQQFTAPVDSITKNIKHIISSNSSQFCAFILCIIFYDGFDTNWLKLKSIPEIIKCKLEDIVKEFEIDISKELSRNALKCGFTTLDGTYLKQRNTEYRIIHDKIYKMAAVICGQRLTECFLKHAPSIFIRDHFIIKSITEDKKTDDLITLSEDIEEEYFERLLRDLKEFVITSTFHNKQLIYQSFRDKLINFLGKSHEAKDIFKTLDTKLCEVKGADHEQSFHTTPLIESASCGYFDIVNFLIVTTQCNVNKEDYRGRSPLYKAAERGKSDVVKLLLENNADVFHCNIDRESPLYVACHGGHIDIAKLLLYFKADVSQCNKLGKSPLYVACREGHIYIVNLLLQSKADVSKCTMHKKSPLYVACEGGHQDAVQLLLKYHADVSMSNRWKWSPLFVACKGGHIDTVNILLQNNANVSLCNKSGWSPLYVACEGGYTDIVKLLLQNNANISQRNKSGWSPLFVACKGGQTDTVKLLLQNNADVSLCNNCGWSPLYVVCEGGHTDIVAMLLQNNAAISTRNNLGNTALYAASKGGHTDTVNILLQNDAEISLSTKKGGSPLHVACEEGHTDTVHLLLQNNADVFLCNNEGETPLFLACKRGKTETVKLLLQNNANVSQCEGSGGSSLYVACKGGYTDTEELLLKNHADVFLCNSHGDSPLFVACERGKIDTAKLLIQNKSDVFHCNNDGESPLYIACKRGQRDTVKLLLQNHADLSKCKLGEPPLNAACEKGYTETVELLLQHNADVSHCSTNGKSPLYVVCEGGHTVTVNLLLQHNADVSQCEISGESPLFTACKGGYTEIVEVLLQNNADINQCNSNGDSPLYVACLSGYTNMVKYLPQNKADITHCNNAGKSPLYVACEGGHLNTVEMLLQNNANVSHCASSGASPLYAACKEGHRAIVELLLQNKADVSQCELNGQTPLHAACTFYMFHLDNPEKRNESFTMVKLLIEWNATVEMRNKIGQTSLDIVRESKCKDIVNLLEKNLRLKTLL